MKSIIMFLFENSIDWLRAFANSLSDNDLFERKKMALIPIILSIDILYEEETKERKNNRNEMPKSDATNIKSWGKIFGANE